MYLIFEKLCLMNYLRSKVFGRKNKKSYVYSNLFLVKKQLFT